ncbi:hypothetical protein [Paenibacillus jiagnxiensis]|uniref:hypothetical protein n=1 Tax=Paenibacillus jiagnxiensis TaxID=3228926 RepID=UPI0033B6F4B5
MTINKKKFGLAILAVSSIGLASFLTTGYTSTNSMENNAIPEVSVSANYIAYETVDRLDSGAELIVVGSASQEFDDRKHMATYFEDGTIQDFYTLTDIKVDKVIKAPEESNISPGDSLTIIEPISYVEDSTGIKKITTEDYSELEKDEKNIIFLQENAYGQYSVINMELGKFSLETPMTVHSATYEKNSFKAEFRADVIEKYNLN